MRGSTQDGCSWTAVTNESWITITSGSSGTGSGTVNYSVSANSSTSQKTGTMTIAGKTFTVTQDGIIPAEVHHFTFDIISTQTAGTAFNITDISNK
ncbi:MAG: hypothetical protein J7L19_05855 [Dehalococcoidia bacterium]|nr:hypothetical protein [Dehalococcoidia bacterium]